MFTQYEGTTTYGMEFHYRFDRDPSMRASTVFSITQTDKPLSAVRNEFEVNYRVDDLHAFVAQLQDDGVATEKVEEFDYGRFAWVRDPDNNRLELYEPLTRAGEKQ